MKPEAFAHLPALRERIVHPDCSELRLTATLLQRWDEHAQAMGRPADWRLPDAEVQASRRHTLAGRDPAQDLWIYAYGSLMWDPALHFEEVRRAVLPGYQRRFSFRTHVGRGSPDCPGLMLAIEPRPGNCEGLVFRIAAGRVEEESAILWRREMLRGSYLPALLPVSTPQGPLTAVVFTSNPLHCDHVAEMTLADTARQIARAAGLMGRNSDYLLQLAGQLGCLGIIDGYIEQLLLEVQARPGA